MSGRPRQAGGTTAGKRRCTPYTGDLAREFRFDDARARYIVADYDPNDAARPGTWTPFGDALLSDYDGVTPYLDGQADPNTYDYSPTRRHFGTAGHADLDAQGSPVAEAHYHGDLIDSTMLTTDSGGASVASVAYTAFGEPGGAGVSPASLDTRYQYAGGWGYEWDLLGLQGANIDLPALTFQHLGWRWYQPDTGRFIQRDPIGLAGGLNVYDYVWGRPTIAIDPSGLRSPASCGCDCGCGCCGGGQDDPSFGEKVGAGAAGTAVGVGLGYLACTVIGISTGGVGGVIIIGVGGFVGGTTGVGISTGEVGLPAGPSGPPQPSGWGGNTDGRSEPGGPYQ